MCKILKNDFKKNLINYKNVGGAMTVDENKIVVNAYDNSDAALTHYSFNNHHDDKNKNY